MLKNSRITILFIFLLAIVSFATFITGYTINERFTDATARVENAYQVLYKAEQLSGNIENIQFGCSVKEPPIPMEAKAICDSFSALAFLNSKELRLLTQDNPLQQKRIDSLTGLLQQGAGLLRKKTAVIAWRHLKLTKKPRLLKTVKK